MPSRTGVGLSRAVQTRGASRLTNFYRNSSIGPAERVARFYNGRGTAEQYIKEGKNAID